MEYITVCFDDGVEAYREVDPSTGLVVRYTDAAGNDLQRDLDNPPHVVLDSNPPRLDWMV